MHNADNNNRTELPLTMQAVVAYAPGDYRLEEVALPKVGEGEVLIKVEACGICAGDLKAYEGLGSPHFPACHRHSPPEEVNKSGIRASASGALLQRG